jgi:hypothetical protein
MNIDAGDIVVEPDADILALYPDVFGYPYDGGYRRVCDSKAGYH